MQLEFLLVSFCTYVITVIGQQQRSTKSVVERIDDLDSLKKFLRTKNNVLVLYATGSKTENHELNEVIRLLASVSLSLYGKCTIISVDCSTENGRKTCKRMTVALENKPYLLYHYNSGKFNKEYDRSLTEVSLIRFLNDPTADMPWEEEKDAADVYHVPDAKAWYKSLKEQKLPILAMFYAPWCGYCKRLKPHYTAAAAGLRSTAILAALDVTRPELYELQQLYNITGFPTVLYFQEGQLKFQFGGAQTKDGIVEWMKNPRAGSPNAGSVEEIVWSEEQNGVVYLQDDTFDAFVSENPSVLVMFYAPWCGHCKAMKGDYAESAKRLKEQNVGGILAAVDATKAKRLAEKFGITGFPSLKYFKDGKFAWDFNERTKEKMVEFMKDPQEPPPPPPPEKPWHEEETNVVHLVGDDFRSELKKRKHALVIFYAPWCGHCKTTKPEFVAAAEHFKNNSKAAFAAVDCTNEANQFICKGQDIKGFPTIRYFNYLKNAEDYLGGRLASDFIGYIDAKAGPPAPTDEPVLPPAEAPADEYVGYQQADEDDTSDPESWGYVKMLTPENYRDVMNSVQRTLVMFFSPSCRYCEEVKPEFKAAAFRIKNRNDVALAALDCVQYLDACMDFRVAGYPSLFLFDKINFVDIHHGKPTRENFVRTILAHLESEKGQPPSSTPPKSEL